MYYHLFLDICQFGAICRYAYFLTHNEKFWAFQVGTNEAISLTLWGASHPYLPLPNKKRNESKHKKK